MLCWLSEIHTSVLSWRLLSSGMWYRGFFGGLLSDTLRIKTMFRWLMSWKELPWHNGDTIFDICLVRQAKSTENLRLAAVLAGIQTDYLLNKYITSYLKITVFYMAPWSLVIITSVSDNLLPSSSGWKNVTSLEIIIQYQIKKFCEKLMILTSFKNL